MVNDTTSMYAGNGREVDVLANDTDADSPDDLAVCRLGDETYKRVFADDFGDGVIFAYSLPRRQARHLHVHLLRLRLPDAGARHAHA